MEDAVVILFSPKYLRTSPIPSQFMLLEERSSFECTNSLFHQNGYTYIDFDLMGTDNTYWASQLATDLENLYWNEGLKLVGGYFKPNDLTKFRLIMYSVELYERTKRFDLEIVSVYKELDAQTLQEMLNNYYHNQNKILKCCLNIYENNEEDNVIGVKVNSHLLIFQNLNKNFQDVDENVYFIVTNFPKLDRKKNPSETMELFINE